MLKELSYIVLTPVRVKIPGERIQDLSRREKASSVPSRWLGRFVAKARSLQRRRQGDLHATVDNEDPTVGVQIENTENVEEVGIAV
ncbi:hypothetical protein HHX47_DHR6000475 [Lentinula edodes]|nr:hypothetical protein HHX47_DHR6000475 [Lentinula edodes]